MTRTPTDAEPTAIRHITDKQAIEAAAKAIAKLHHPGLTPAELEKTWAISEGSWCQDFRDDAKAAIDAACKSLYANMKP